MRREIGQTAWRLAALAAGAFALSALLAVPADARARICRTLEAKLASAGSGGGGGSAQFKKYDRAVGIQRDQLSTARSRARRAGCGFTLLNVGPAVCAPLNTQIERMERNLDALQRKRTALSGGGSGSRRDRSRILAALDANNCRGEGPVVADRRAEPRGDGRSFFDRLFGDDVREGLPEEEIRPLEPLRPRDPLQESERPATVARILNPNGEVSVIGPVGQFATMCVRSCDGYYFPMSPNSSSADFDRDLKNCESACPGAEMQLYYQQEVGEDSEIMVSAGTGEPYSALPTAYLYRDGTRPQACGCTQTANGYSIVGGEPIQRSAPAAPMTPAPVGQPDPADDPETVTNRQGGPDGDTIKPKPATPPVAATGERRIRVVGPVFLPDPAGAIDLKAPGPKQVR